MSLTKHYSRLLALACAALVFVGCSDESYKLSNDQFILGVEQDHTKGSTVEGNLITTAIRETHRLDFVFYPSSLIKTSAPAFLDSEFLNENHLNDILDVYPRGMQDQFIIGSMRGRDVKRFILERTGDTYSTDLQVAGLTYDIGFLGGWPQYAYYRQRGGAELDDNRTYRVAVSRYYYFSGNTFPSYKYRNGLGLRDFTETSFISARESLSTYLRSGREWPYLREPRANVSRITKSHLGRKTISEIQGIAHLSPFKGHQVITRGIVTAVGSVGHYPGGEEAFIQCPNGDGDLRSSDALHLHWRDQGLSLEIGDMIEVEGVVYEQVFDAGLSRTSLREIKNVRVLSSNNTLPEPVILGEGGRAIPDSVISSWQGNVNFRPSLNLNDALDFYESLEGMRVTIRNPRITGFQGGNEEFYRNRPKGYLNVWVVPDGHRTNYQTTPTGGQIIDQKKGDFNPNVIQITNNHFTNGMDNDAFYDVGKIIEGELTGILAYEPNVFGGAEYTILLPEVQDDLVRFTQDNKRRTPIEERPITRLVPTENQLTVAAYNIENLAGNQLDRLEEIGKSIAINLQCPDILTLVEVQDENGVDFAGDSSAEVTLQRLIDFTPCGSDVDYRSIHVEPFMNNDGGQPGGNIQVAYLYNANRVHFRPRGNPNSLMDTVVSPQGGLRDNPARLFTRDAEFRNTRKSLLIEVEFRGERIYLISNHYNSRFGDTGLYDAVQPQVLRSDIRRQQKAKMINNFVQLLQVNEPDAKVIVLGDFNAFIEDRSMRILAGEQMHNLTTYKDLMPFNDRYSFNFRGNSQAIDHIFATHNLLRNHRPEVEIPHINTDFMGRLADHDPIISRFYFR